MEESRLRVRQRTFVEHPKQNGARTAGERVRRNEHGPVDNCDAQQSAAAPCEDDGRDLQFADLQMLVIIFLLATGARRALADAASVTEESEGFKTSPPIRLAAFIPVPGEIICCWSQRVCSGPADPS